MPILSDLANATGLGAASPIVFVIRVIQIFLGLLGLIAVILVLYAGFLWLTSAGNQDKITKAKKILKNAFIGIAIIFLSISIVTYIGTFFKNVTNGTGGDFSPGGDQGGGGGFGGLPSSGFNVVSTSPSDGDTSVKACTRAQGIFNDTLNADSVRSGVTFVQRSTSQSGEFTVNSNAFSFEKKNAGVHADWVGGSAYTMVIPKSVKDAQSRNLDVAKNVTFTAVATTDSDKPTVTRSYPPTGSGNICLRSNIQIQFSESINIGSVNTTNIVLRKKGTVTPLEYRLSFSSLDLVTITPTSQLEPNTAYELVVKGIEDACGNVMNGTFVSSFTTGDSTRLQCEPEIRSLNQASGFYQDTLVTISGANLGLGGEVEFHGMPAGSNSFDGKPNVTCWAGQDLLALRGIAGGYPANAGSCQANEIKVRVPVNSTTGTLQLLQSFTNEAASNASSVFTVKSPFITSISPHDAPTGQFMSIFGYNFGETPGKVHFSVPGGRVVEAQSPQCSNVWSDNQVVIKVPPDFAIGDAPRIEVVAGTLRSNQGTSMKMLSGSPGPGICSISPSKDDKGKPYVLSGEAFGASASGSSVKFGDTVAQSPTWADALIQGTTPQDLTPGTYVVRVSRSGINSNSVLFTTPATRVITPPCEGEGCDGGGGPGGRGCVNGVCPPGSGSRPQVLDIPSCDATHILQSPSPYIHKTDVCTVATIYALFDRAMNATSMNASTLVLNKVNGNVKERVNGSISLVRDVDGVKGFQLTPLVALLPSTVYEMTIVGGNTGVQSVQGRGLTQDKVWTFTTGSGSCSPSALSVFPSYALTSGLPLSFSALPVASCVALSPVGFTFLWSTPNGSSVVTVSSVVVEGSTQGRVVVKSGVSGVTRDIRVIASVQGEQNGVQGEAKVDVVITGPTTPPVVEQFSPSGSNVCRNAEIEMTFDQELDTGNISSALLLRKVDSSDPVPFEVRSLILPTHNTKLILIPGVLDATKRYTLTVTTDLKGINGRNVVSNRDFLFTTRATVCTPSKIKLLTNPIYFTSSGSQVIFAGAYTNDNVALSQGEPPLWEWTWSSVDNAIASLASRIDTDQVTITPEVNEGRTIVRASASVTGSSPITLVDQASVEISYCANPWVLYQGGTYDAYLRYCRDGGLPGVRVNERTTGLKAHELSEFFYPVDESMPGGMSQADAFAHPSNSTSNIRDAIGFQIYENPKHFSAQEWYDDQVRNNVFSKGSPQSTVVGPWNALRDGNTYFIAGPGGVLPSSVYTNIFVLTYNEGASQGTKAIMDQLLENIRFLGRAGLSTDDEKKLARDMTRLADVGRIRRALKNTKDSQGAYPTIPAGSFKANESTSKWPVSWKGFGIELGITMPEDPSNVFGAVCSTTFGAGYDDTTCYNNKVARNVAFQCPVNSHVYTYAVNSSGSAYTLSFNPEYRVNNGGSVTWQGQPQYTISQDMSCQSTQLNQLSPL